MRKSFEPVVDGGDAGGGPVSDGEPVVPGGRAAVVLETAQAALDAVPAGPPLARGAGAHGGACPPTPASRSSRRRRPGRPGPPRCAPAPRSAAGRGTGRAPSTRARSGPGAPPPGRPDPGASPHGVDHGAQRAAGARAAPTGHRPGHGGRMRPHPSSEAFAGIAIRFRTTRDAPRASPRPARHAAPHPTCATRPDRRAHGLSDVLTGRPVRPVRSGRDGTRTGTATTPSRLPDGRGPSVRAGRRLARCRGPPGHAPAGPGLRNASSAQHNPPRLAPCEPSATESTCARFSRARLARCELR